MFPPACSPLAFATQTSSSPHFMLMSLKGLSQLMELLVWFHLQHVSHAPLKGVELDLYSSCLHVLLLCPHAALSVQVLRLCGMI